MNLRRFSLVSIIAITFLLLTGRCLDPYHSSSGDYTGKDLVVDAFYNATDGSCTVTLSRVLGLESLKDSPVEAGATVHLVDETGSSYLLSETVAGTYNAGSLTFGAGDQISLHILTKDNVEYESTVIPVLITSPIDSLIWESKREGLALYISTHNDNTNRYYYWKFTETWQHVAAYRTTLTRGPDFQPVPLTEQIYDCWTTLPSSNILVSSSSQLSSNVGVVNNFPLTTVPWSSTKLYLGYSIEAEQHSITKETYEYLTQLEKNTENLGTLFDPLPSSPQGNLRCVSHPDQHVQGNFTASSISKKRVFIRTTALDWPEGTVRNSGNGGCTLFEIRFPSDWQGFWPVWSGVHGDPMKGTTENCVDCRLNGGTNVQPDFWE